MLLKCREILALKAVEWRNEVGMYLCTVRTEGCMYMHIYRYVLPHHLVIRMPICVLGGPIKETLSRSFCLAEILRQ